MRVFVAILLVICGTAAIAGQQRPGPGLAELKQQLVEQGQCVELHWVCLDHSHVVFFPNGSSSSSSDGSAASPPVAKPLPRLPILPIGRKPFIVPTYPDTLDNLAFGTKGFLPLALRWATLAEPTHLAEPKFTSSQLPVIVFPFVPYNFARNMEHLAGWLFNATGRLAERSAIRLIVQTPLGLELPPHMTHIFSTLGFGSVESLARASNRRPASEEVTAE